MTARTRQNLGAGVLILALMFGAAAYASQQPESDPFGAAAIVERPFPSLTYGIQGFFWWDTGYTGLQLDWVRMMSFNHVKQTFAWRDMEPEPGRWTFHSADRILAETARRQIRVIARLGLPPAWAGGIPEGDGETARVDTPPTNRVAWANYCATVATRYAGRIAAYQIWNEPNLSREWGGQPPDAVAYVQLLRECSRAIRAADPQALIISAGLAPTGNDDASARRDDLYLDDLYRAGFQQYIDVVGVHAPGFSPPAYGPDDAERDGRGRWFSFRRVEDLRKIMLRYDDAARQMAILEMGWTVDRVNPAYAWFAVSDAQQADYTVAAFEYIRQHWSPWVGLVSLIYLPKSSWTEQDEEYWWAIALPNHHARPVFGALVQMAKYCDDYVIPARTDVSEEGILATLDACP